MWPTGSPDATSRRRQQAAVASELARTSLDQPWHRHAAGLLARLVVTAFGVVLCDAVVPGFEATPPWGPIGFAVVLGAVALGMQPAMVAGAVRLGWTGVLLLAFAGQAVVVAVAARILPDVEVDGFWTALLVAIVLGLVGTVASW